ncbi:hypothetical protein LEN26_020410 [Aphanomyces euteiches]|nr:hypothetical protein LEN26_020410 [Aphanomyces euteiches]KAH9127082.1 hypothetical protein AeMF1_002567 [Aphanomyces euteiches]KAH9184358.1 hypothetical protein AeNC1_013660 [Aphanomyces euteiches]
MKVVLHVLLLLVAALVVVFTAAEPQAPSYLAMIQSQGINSCTGVLIAPQYVVTVVPCTTAMTPMRVALPNELLNVTRFTVHPLSNLSRTEFSLAVLQLGQSSANRPATLSFDVLAPQTRAIVRGFGSLNATTPSNATSAVQEKDGLIHANSECAAWDNTLVLDDMVCLSDVYPCGRGNRGSAVTVVQNSQEVVVALLSWSWVPCNRSYTVFERISTAKTYLEPYLPSKNACAMAFQRPQLSR